MIKKIIHYTVFGDLKMIYEVFADLKKYANFHPLIFDAQELQNKEYLIKEKPFKWLPFVTKYRAVVELSGNQIKYQVLDIPLSKAIFEYTFKEIADSGHIEISFSLSLESKMVGKRMLFNKMIKSQNELMEKLNNSLQ